MYTVTTKAPTIRLKIRLKKTRILPTAVIGPSPLALHGAPTNRRRRRPASNAVPHRPPKFPLTSGAGLCRQAALVSITNSARRQHFVTAAVAVISQIARSFPSSACGDGRAAKLRFAPLPRPAPEGELRTRVPKQSLRNERATRQVQIREGHPPRLGHSVLAQPPSPSSAIP